jgi:Tfp pilus assembly protein PilF
MSNPQLANSRYKAFISYSHQDDKWASWLHRALEAYKPPKNLVGQTTYFGEIPDRLAPIFRDREELPTATDLGEVLSQALQDSACQIVLCSPAAAQSKWVNEEILAFKRLGREDRIFCLIISGEPNASDLPEGRGLECFPEALRYKLGADGNLSGERAEPIAADARENKDGRANAKLKLIAGMLGVGYDSLAQREQIRRQQRMMTIAAVSIVGMVITSGLAITAMLARAEAEQQRVRAESEAETAQQTTNFLVELFEISDPSEALGNSITAREILDRGARRIEFELADQPAIRSTLMDTMGTVYRSLGLYSEAQVLLQQGLNTRRELFGANHPAVARSQSNIAEVLGLQAEFAEATGLYQEAIETLRNSAEADDAEIAKSLVGLAYVHSLQGDFESSEVVLQEAITLQKPSPSIASLDLAESLDQLGMARFFQGKFEEAEPLLLEALAMRRTLLPAGIHPDLDDSLNNLAIFRYEQGQFTEAEALFRESLDINMRLLGEGHPDLGISMNNLAFVLQDSGNLQGAEEFYLQALAIRREGLPEAHPLVAQSLNNLAFLYEDLGQRAEVLLFSRQAVEAYRRAYDGDHPDLAYGLQNLASWLVEEGEFDSAESMLEEALAMNSRLLTDDHPDVGITKSGMAVLLLETNRAQDALIMAEEAYEVLVQAYGEDHWRTAWAQSIQGAALSELGQYERAEPLLVAAYEYLSNSLGARASYLEKAQQRMEHLFEISGSISQDVNN